MDAIQHTCDTLFYIEELVQTLALNTSDIFNADQGAQYTSLVFTQLLLDKDIKISTGWTLTDFDNIFVKRMWRTVKYENIYMNDYQSVPELRFVLNQFFEFYSHQRLHQSLNYLTPAEIYFSLK